MSSNKPGLYLISAFKYVFFATLILFILLILFEYAAYLYLSNFANRGRIYVSDTELGWKLLPNLNVRRLNSAKKIYNIITDSDGFRGRGISSWSDNKKKMLILGDSVAFGYGVDIQWRFDSIILNLRNDINVLNLGVPGYGIEQGFIAARKYFNRLKERDILLIISNYTDFFDILRKSSFGRPKPWFESRPGGLREYRPSLNFTDYLSDRSFIVLKLKDFFEKKENLGSTEDFHKAAGLYSDIVRKETADLRNRKVQIIIAFTQKEHLNQMQMEIASSMFEELVRDLHVKFFSLDDVLSKDPSLNKILPCNHWAEYGHRIVGYALNDFLNTLEK